MGRPQNCNCKCGTTDPTDPPTFTSDFFTVIFQDEAEEVYSNPSRSYFKYDEDLRYLRAKEQTIGRCEMAIMQVVEGCCGSRMKPPGRDDGGVNGFPVEVIYHQTGVKRNQVSNTDRNRLKHITENILRGNYDCFVVFIDDSASTTYAVVADLLNEWYWNISTSEASHATYVRYIVDSAGNPNPLSSCDSGGGDKANGCVYEIKNRSERWLLHAADGAQKIYDDPDSCAGGNVSGCDCTQKTGWPEICAVFMDKSKVPTTVNFNISWIKAGTLSDGVAPFVELKDTYGTFQILILRLT